MQDQPSLTIGTRHVVWCPNPEVIGAVHWGTFDELAARRLEEVLRLAESAQLAPSCSVVVDCRDVDSVDFGSLAVLVGSGPERARARIGTGRHVLVVPPGPRGMLISGALLQRHGRWRVFHDQDEALASLDRADARTAHAEATRAAASIRRMSPLIVGLRRDLAGELVGARVGRSARHLATSVRTLQRELHRHGTSYSKELLRARLAAALDLLRNTDLKIEAIAARTGMGRSSRLSQQLRARFGCTANELRARVRAARPGSSREPPGDPREEGADLGRGLAVARACSSNT